MTPTRMPISINYGTHLAALMVAMSKTTGPVLELGMGVFSTPYLHYACLLAGRQLVSYDNDAGYAGFFTEYGAPSPHHIISVVEDWDEAEIERPWDVALIDHTPDWRRITEAARLAHHARYVVIHDSNGRYENTYRYSAIYPLFQYRAIWDQDSRHATVLSNFVDLTDFWDEHARTYPVPIPA